MLITAAVILFYTKYKEWISKCYGMLIDSSFNYVDGKENILNLSDKLELTK